MDENQRTWQQPVQPGGMSTGPGIYHAPDMGPGAPVPPGVPRPPVTRRAPRRRRRRSGWNKSIVAAMVAGIVGALLVLLVMPVSFGVNPYDLVRGKLRKVTSLQEKAQPG
jgi:hypothetical protein